MLSIDEIKEQINLQMQAMQEEIDKVEKEIEAAESEMERHLCSLRQHRSNAMYDRDELESALETLGNI